MLNEDQAFEELMDFFSEENICKALVAEYFTNGHLLREDILHAFEDFPGVVDLLERLKRRMVLYI